MRKGIRKHRKLVIAAVIVLVIAGAGAILLPRFLKKEDQPAAQAKQSTVQLSKMDLTKSVSATGTIESAKVKTVSASLSNVEIKSVKVKEGDTVKKGQTLVTFEQKRHSARQRPLMSRQRVSRSQLTARTVPASSLPKTS